MTIKTLNIVRVNERSAFIGSPDINVYIHIIPFPLHGYSSTSYERSNTQ